MTDSDPNWRDFSLDPDVRADKRKAWFRGEREVNPDGRLTYGGYLQLDRLLSSQTPGTRVPDERAFIVTHQLCELAFKQMRFDLAVLAGTFGELIPVATTEGLPGLMVMPEEFWRPAITAAGRLLHCSAVLLPAAVGLLEKNPDPTFDSIEFYHFREKLIPASGFQSAQFRSIQRSLGKANLLELRMYPAEFYRAHYGSEDAVGRVAEPVSPKRPVGQVSNPIHAKQQAKTGAETRPPMDAVSPSDPLILQGSVPDAAPTDDAAHELLNALGKHEKKPLAAPLPILSEADFKIALDKLRRGLKELRQDQVSRGVRPAALDGSDQRILEGFWKGVGEVVSKENARRHAFAEASTGAQTLRSAAPKLPLLSILSLLISADNALHGPGKDSFLSRHGRFVKLRIAEVNDYALQSGLKHQIIGTGGGGAPYLDLMHKYLIPHFPALVGWR